MKETTKQFTSSIITTEEAIKRRTELHRIQKKINAFTKNPLKTNVMTVVLLEKIFLSILENITKKDRLKNSLDDFYLNMKKMIDQQEKTNEKN